VKGLETVTRFFCSELSRRAAETPTGTASTGAIWFLLEYPHGWGRHALEDSALSNETKQFFANAVANIPRSRTLFIKTDRGRRDARMNFFVVRCRERSPSIIRFQLEKYDDLCTLDLSAVVAGTNLQGGVVNNSPLFLVCTHGRRDKCCAKFGIPVYNALRASETDAVWQSSHVGGDRFAANLVCFPHGLFYAHLNEHEGERIAAEYRAGRLVLDKFRGRACYAHQVQAAEFFVRAQSGVDGVDALRFHSSAREGEKEWRVRFNETDTKRMHEARVSCRMSEFTNFITCHSTEEKPVQQFTLDEYNTTDAP
jgi:hypothetical protein